MTEDHKGPNSFTGSALKSGYASHFIVTKKDGNVYNYDRDSDFQCNGKSLVSFFFVPFYSKNIEIVVGQESQILPTFLIKLNIEDCLKELDKWNRTVVEPETTIENESVGVEKAEYCIDMTQKEETYDDYKLLI